MRRAPTTLACTLSAGLAATLLAPVGTAAADSPPIVVEDGVSQPVYSYDDAIEEVVYVEAPMDSDLDGANDLIEVDVIRPAETADDMTVATIMEASPYYGRASGTPEPDETRGFPGWWDEYFVPRGYAIVQVEMQGTGRSFGCPTTGGVEDTTSIEAVVDWLNGRAPGYYHDGSEATADWSTGDVGMQGVSYVGTLPNAVATQGVPGLRTVVPIAAISNWYQYPNDQGLGWRGWGTRYTEFLANYVSVGRSLPGSASEDACDAVIEQLGDDEDATNHDFTAFWQERDYVPDANKIKTADTAVFMVHGLTDFNVKTTHTSTLWDAVAQRQMPRKIWIHRGGHSNPVGFRQDEWQSVMHRWMDHWLYGIENGIMDEPMADIQRPDGTWETHSTWPDAEADDVKLRLGPASATEAGTLTPGPGTNGTQSFLDDLESQSAKVDNAEQARPGRLVYLTPVLDQDVRISGTPQIDVRFASSADTALLSAMIVDYGEAESVTVEDMTPLELVEASCDPEDLAARTGCATPQEVSVEITPQRVLAWGHVDGKNHVDLRRGSPLDPGKKYHIQWDTQPVDHIIPAGHRIGLVLTGNYFANPFLNSPAVDADALGAQITIELKQSDLTLPVVGGAGVLGF